MSGLKAGFARVNVTPMMGIGMAGYFISRYADGVLDEMEINAVALALGDTKVVLLSMDHEGITRSITTEFRRNISHVTGVPMEAIYIHATHSHTGPFLKKDSEDQLEQEYYQLVYHRMADAAQFALDDLKPAEMGWGVGKAPNVAFGRRYLMKDGSIRTNPGVGNPDIVKPIGEVDDSVNVIRFNREGAETIVLTSMGCHPDVVGGCKISADWPGFTRRTVEKAIDGCKCVFFNGAEGDVNHVNVHPQGGDLNDMFMDFDDVSRGYGHSRHMGRVVAGAVLQTYDKVKYTDVASLRFLQRTIRVPSNMPNTEDMPEAYRLDALHRAGKNDEIPYTGMMLTTVVAEAGRMIRLEHGPETFDMELSGISIGDVALVGIPGEPFNAIGKGLKETEGWGLIIPTCLTNGHEGYFPMKSSYEEGGYEARSSNFKAGVAEYIIEEGKSLLYDLH